MKIKLIISILFCITAISCSKDDDSAFIQTNDWEYLSLQKILGSHRGLLGYPENSYEGILAAIKAGYKVIEIDVARTKDGVFVVHHDATIDRCSDGQGYVKDYTFEELQQFNFGHYMGGAFPDTKISTLTEILERQIFFSFINQPVPLQSSLWLWLFYERKRVYRFAVFVHREMQVRTSTHSRTTNATDLSCSIHHLPLFR